MDLIKDSMPPTRDMLFVMMHENLISMIDEKYTPVPKFFTGDEEERVEWVKNVIKEKKSFFFNLAKFFSYKLYCI